MKKTQLFYYNQHGIECQPAEASLVSEVELPEPKPDANELSRPLWPIHEHLGLEMPINIIFGNPPRLLVGCRRDVHWPLSRAHQGGPRVKDLDEAGLHMMVFEYQNGRFWLNTARAQRYYLHESTA